MTVRNDNVRRVTLPDGSPVPQPQTPCRIDIVLFIPILYLGEIIASVFTAAILVWSMLSTSLFFGSPDGKCEEAVGPATYAMAALILVKLVLATIVSLILFAHT